MRAPLDRFCDALIAVTGRPIPWARGAPRDQVRAALLARGFELLEDGDDDDPRLKRFFAAPLDALTAANARIAELERRVAKALDKLDDRTLSQPSQIALAKLALRGLTIRGESE